MRILFTRFPLESRLGGAEVQTLSLMQRLMARGNAVAFLGSDPVLLDLCGQYDIPNAELLIGNPPVTKFGVLSFAWRKKKMQQRLEAAVTEFGGIQTIIMLSLSEKLLLTPFALKKGLRVIWVEHDRVGPWIQKNPWKKRLVELSKSVTTVTVSQLSRKLYIDMGWDEKNVVTIPNGIDEERFSNTESGVQNSSLIMHHSLHVGTVARLTEDKGVDVLIQAVAEMPDTDCTIVGSGSDEMYLHGLVDEIAQREVTDTSRIRITHEIDDLGDFYRSLDVFVLPSRENDPFGMVAAEAMLCGTATIVTDVCGISAYLSNDSDALIIPANNHKALLDALKKLQDPVLRKRIAEQGRRTAKEKFSLEKMVDEYEKVLSRS